MKKIILIFVAAVALSSCASKVKNPPENVPPSPVFKSEGITFDGSEWYHARFADKLEKGYRFPVPLVLTKVDTQ